MNEIAKQIQASVDARKDGWAEALYNEIRRALFHFQDENGVTIESSGKITTVHRHGGFRMSLTYEPDCMILVSNSITSRYTKRGAEGLTKEVIDKMADLLTEASPFGRKDSTTVSS